MKDVVAHSLGREVLRGRGRISGTKERSRALQSGSEQRLYRRHHAQCVRRGTVTLLNDRTPVRGRIGSCSRIGGRRVITGTGTLRIPGAHPHVRTLALGVLNELENGFDGRGLNQ